MREPHALPSAADQANEPTEAGTANRVGPYKLLQRIGEGGMGSVWLAEQTEPVRRKVALKLIKPGMDSGQVLARFEAERQALALMDHPNIAKVLDAGTTEGGRPYFVMELVKGVPLTRFCDEQKLSIRERLELFVAVCQAIQHAHQKGIIHRDIKPSNVLVALYDGKPVPKVIDFGLAKAMGATLTDRTLFTGIGMVMGTLEYMSPEQAEVNQLDIDTRTDIYSLGVLLYQLLTGTTPLRSETVKQGAWDELLRRVREQESPRPSMRLSESQDALPTISDQRKLEPAQLMKLLRGDLDWIVMKCLEKDRSRRYQAVNGLAADIERHLHDEPILARPPSAGYRIRKLIKKHRGQVTAAAAFTLLLVAATVVSAALGLWANRERSRAETARNRATHAEAEAKNNEQKAKESETEARTVLQYFEEKVLKAARPTGEDGGLGHDVTLREAVDAAEKDIASSLSGHPLVEASIRSTLGITYMHFGDNTKALAQHERHLALVRAHKGATNRETLVAMGNVAAAFVEAKQPERALPLLEEARPIMEAHYADDVCFHSMLNNLAAIYLKIGRATEALPILQRVLELRRARYGVRHLDTIRSLNSLAETYRHVGRKDEATSLFEEALSVAQEMDVTNRTMVVLMNNLARSYADAGRMSNAFPLYERALGLQGIHYPTNHPTTVTLMDNLGRAYGSAGDLTNAIAWLERAWRGREEHLPQEHPLILEALELLVRYSLISRRFADTERFAHELLSRRRKVLPEDDGAIAETVFRLADALVRQEKFQEAEPYLRESLQRLEQRARARSLLGQARAWLGWCLMARREFASAEPLLLQGWEELAEHERARDAQGVSRIQRKIAELLVELYEKWGQPDQAAEWRKKSVEATNGRVQGDSKDGNASDM